MIISIDHKPLATKPRRMRDRLFREFLIYAGIPYFSVVLIFVLFQRKLMYQPTKADSLTIADCGLTSEFGRDVRLATEDGETLRGWLVKGRSVTKDRSQVRPLILYFPGNSLNRKTRVNDLREVAARGFDVLIFDYRGFGDSTGYATESALSIDAQTIWSFAHNELGYEPEDTVVFGESLGGAVALSLWKDADENERKPAALILNSTFASMPETVRWLYPMFPFDRMLWDCWPSIDRIAKVPSPVIVFHGTDDQLVPVAQGRQLANAARDGKFVEIQGGMHNEIPTVALRRELDQIRVDRQ